MQKQLGIKVVEIAENEIDVVMAGIQRKFCPRRLLAAEQSLYWVCDRLNNECEISDYKSSHHGQQRL